MTPDKTIHEIAAACLRCKAPMLLHSDLYDFLTDINELVYSAGGEVASRQVTALAIATWLRMNPGKRAFGE